MCDFEREVFHPLESHAPLADAQLPRTQGLTLEDLEQWHAGGAPEQGGELFELSPAPALPTLPSAKVRVLKKSRSEANLSLEHSDDEVTLDSLKALLEWHVGPQHRYALNKREDLKRLTKQNDLLFQRVPQFLERLTQVVHAHEQCQILYARLAELSEKRGSAALIIQTARQVEVLEKNLKEKCFRAEELKKMQADLDAHLSLTKRYQAIFQQVSALDILNLD